MIKQFLILNFPVRLYIFNLLANNSASLSTSASKLGGGVIIFNNFFMQHLIIFIRAHLI